MKNAIKQLSYVLFPRRCELCGEVVRPDEKYCRDCRHAERINGEICLKSLNKIRETETQRGASAKERRVNLFGAFDLVDGFDIDGKTVLLVDDVKTTGSTLNECSEILKAYGAKAVYCSVFAVTKRKKKNDKK